MKQRLLVAAVGVPLLILVLVFLPPVATGVLVCAIAAAAAYELLHTACKAPCVLVYALTALMAMLTVLVPVPREDPDGEDGLSGLCFLVYNGAVFPCCAPVWDTARAAVW